MDCIRCGGQFDPLTSICSDCGWNPNDTLDQVAGYRQGEIIRDQYEVKGGLGIGRLGTVLEALDLASDTRVALKVIHPGLLPDKQRRDQFLSDVQTLMESEEADAANILDVQMDEDDRCFFVRELFETQTLRTIINEKMQAGRAFSAQEIVSIVAHVARLHTEHSDVAHGALSPEKIWLASSEMPHEDVAIVDTGIACHLPPTAVWHRLRSLADYRGYAAPELIAGRFSDRRTDVYAAGVMIGELLTRTVFDGVPEIFIRIRPALPDPVLAFLDRALHPFPDKRYPDLPALASALEDIAPFITEYRAVSEDTVRERVPFPNTSEPAVSDEPPQDLTTPDTEPDEPPLDLMTPDTEPDEPPQDLMTPGADPDASSQDPMTPNTDPDADTDADAYAEPDPDTSMSDVPDSGISENTSKVSMADVLRGHDEEPIEAEDAAPDAQFSEPLSLEPPPEAVPTDAQTKNTPSHGVKKLTLPATPVAMANGRIEPKRPSKLPNGTRLSSYPPKPPRKKISDVPRPEEPEQDLDDTRTPPLTRPQPPRRDTTQEIDVSEIDVMAKIPTDKSTDTAEQGSTIEALKKLEDQVKYAERESANELLRRAKRLEGVDPRLVRAAHVLESERRVAKSRQAAQLLRERAKNLEDIDPRLLRAAARLEEARVGDPTVTEDEPVPTQTKGDDWREKVKPSGSDNVISFLPPPVVESPSDVKGFPQDRKRGVHSEGSPPPPSPSVNGTPPRRQ
ncbi:MAG: protein kinase [Myxococcota bacterium]|nr:protein kinase [Myxococcota bacterium]